MIYLLYLYTKFLIEIDSHFRHETTLRHLITYYYLYLI
jgi:hypothetical protein